MCALAELALEAPLALTWALLLLASPLGLSPWPSLRSDRWRSVAI